MGETSKKVQESRLKWYGHALRREEKYVGSGEKKERKTKAEVVGLLLLIALLRRRRKVIHISFACAIPQCRPTL